MAPTEGRVAKPERRLLPRYPRGYECHLQFPEQKAKLSLG